MKKEHWYCGYTASNTKTFSVNHKATSFWKNSNVLFGHQFNTPYSLTMKNSQPFMALFSNTKRIILYVPMCPTVRNKLSFRVADKCCTCEE